MTELIIKNLPKILLYLLAAIALLFPYAITSDRWLLPKIIRKVAALVGKFWCGLLNLFNNIINGAINILYKSHGPTGYQPQATSVMVIWVSVILGATLIASFFG